MKARCLVDKQKEVRARFAYIRKTHAAQLEAENARQEAIYLAANAASVAAHTALCAAKRKRDEALAHFEEIAEASYNFDKYMYSAEARAAAEVETSAAEEAAMERARKDNDKHFAGVREVADLDAENGADDCAICLGALDEEREEGEGGHQLHVTRCNHTFHHSCMFSAPVRINTCPMCRVAI